MKSKFLTKLKMHYIFLKVSKGKSGYDKIELSAEEMAKRIKCDKISDRNDNEVKSRETCI